MSLPPPAKRRRKARLRAEKLPPDWQLRRRSILEAANFRCEVGGRRCGEVATEVDHIQPLASGGSNHLHNLRAICAECHLDRRRHYTSRDWT